jgi:hypothetical protein
MLLCYIYFADIYVQCTYVLFSESLIENWYNPNKLLSLNKDFYLFIYLFTRQKRLVGVL